MTTADHGYHHAVHASDMDMLNAITSMPMRNSSAAHAFDPPPRKRHLDTLHALRRPPIDPIVLAASLSSGPHVTRHHFHHSFGPKVASKQMSRSQREKLRREEKSEEREAGGREGAVRGRAGSYANCDRDHDHDRPSKAVSRERARQAGGSDEQATESMSLEPLAPYPSKQAPRSERLRRQEEARIAAEQNKRTAAQSVIAIQQARNPDASHSPAPGLVREPSAQINRALHERKEIIQAAHTKPSALASLPSNAQQSAATDLPTTPSLSSIVRPPPIFVRCYARTRIPTPHGEIFCHLYRNNRDNKEHLALVVDTQQNAIGGDWHSKASTSSSIRSKTLDEVWGPHETEMERIVRGAYVGRLGPNHQVASEAGRSSPSRTLQTSSVEPPLVRIHSECYTGETIGSQRCDCGEQLDEAIRLIHGDSQPARGVVVYLRQEGRGIGLLDKLMAYNLQDMGHDTVSANILLGHLADARKYDVAAEILRDLGVASCRLLTNNPEKMEAMESEGITVQKRVAMVPRVWRHGHGRPSRRTAARSKRQVRGLDESIVSQLDDGGHHQHRGSDDEDEDVSDGGSDSSRQSYVDHVLRRSGATMVGSSITRGPELEKYLRTKVERMGHLLDVPVEQQPSRKSNRRAPSTFSSPPIHGDEDFTSVDAPLTDEEPAMNEADLQQHLHAEGNDGEGDDDEILIKSH